MGGRVKPSISEERRRECLDIPIRFPTMSAITSPPSPPHTNSKVLPPSSGDATRKPGGWKSMVYILGNETFERLATFGLLANFMVYLLNVFHLDYVSATNVLNIWSGTTNFAPLLGAFLSDAYIGKFRTIAFASFASLLGLGTLTLTTWIPNLHPPSCTKEQQNNDQCVGPTSTQMGFLLLGLGFLTVGTGGIRPCSIPFGVDQFDATTEEGRRGINSFFNWYYTSFTVVLMIALTLVVYIQDSISWILGLGIPTLCMLASIILFFMGMRIYVYVKPEGSIFSDIARVFVAAYKKRRVEVPTDGSETEGEFYDPPLMKGSAATKLPYTKQFRCLNKAALILEGDKDSNGCPKNQWRLCSIQQVEEVKCLIQIIPIWASGIICFTAIVQQATFIVSQALQMDRHLGPSTFQIPAGSMTVISMLTIGLWVPFYDRILVPALRKITKREGGITLLQRMGIGMVFSILSMVVSGLVEGERRASAVLEGRSGSVAPMSVMWLAPQLILMGFSEAFNAIGQIEFYNKEFPEHMRSIANALFFTTIAGASYFSSLVVAIVHHVTGKHGRPGWLAKNINQGRVDYYYYLLAILGGLNLIYFMICAKIYRYKGALSITKQEPHLDLEFNQLKH